ncbi:LytR/AlgR family response regulator transcription factor [Segetibacter koreensis]|uniref:LytR/AlgR family response regulator transcription factor n=1 Tax=Segetibacter koreensis TaxID=398037 RepID=UPI0003799454|nr:LytTR family DNA-binding domain-containing protein [Segetibacter koreensis]
MIKAIIIEDEERSREMLRDMLTEHFKNITVMALCKDVAEGKAAIEKFHPDLVFSDIELENSSAFEMLQQIDEIDFEVIFTTAYDKYAIQAIKFSALDYLLKPFSLADLSAALNHYQQKQNKKQSALQFDTLFHNLQNLQKNSKRIALPTSNGLAMIPLNEIIRCQAEVNYTNFFLSNKRKMVIAKTLKEFEELLNEYDFIRVHNSHLINLHHVVNYTRGEGGIITMSDGSEVDVSRRKKDEFLARLASI